MVKRSGERRKRGGSSMGVGRRCGVCGLPLGGMEGRCPRCGEPVPMVRGCAGCRATSGCRAAWKSSLGQRLAVRPGSRLENSRHCALGQDRTQGTEPDRAPALGEGGAHPQAPAIGDLRGLNHWS